MWKRSKRTLLSFASRQLVPSAHASPASQLIWRDRLPAEIVNRHDEAGEIHPVSMYDVTRVEYGGLGVLKIDGKPFAPAECFPHYLENMLVKNVGGCAYNWCGGLFSWRRRKIKLDRPLLAPFHPNFVYGHFLLEMMPRLLIADQSEPTGAPIALSTSSPRWVKAVVEALAPSREIVWFDSATETLVPTSVLLPSGLQSRHEHIHPHVRSLITGFKERIGVQSVRPAVKRLYLSRSRQSNPYSWHNIHDEEAVERIFNERGFEVVHPQELSFERQIALYDEADIIAGEFSSALHNALFARSGCRVLAINWINWYQSRISSLMDQPIAYLPTEIGFIDWQSQASGFQTLKIDHENLRLVLDEFLKRST